MSATPDHHPVTREDLADLTNLLLAQAERIQALESENADRAQSIKDLETDVDELHRLMYDLRIATAGIMGVFNAWEDRR